MNHMWTQQMAECVDAVKWAGSDLWFDATDNSSHLQYRHLISAPVDRTSANAWLYEKPC